MATNKAVSKQPSKLTLMTVFLVVLFWVAIVMSGVRLPYIYTDFSFQFRAYILFPILFGTLCYFMFFYRFKGRKDNAYNLRMKKVSSSKDKAKLIAVLSVGLVFIPAIISWTSIAFPAWVTKLMATEAYLQSFKVSKVNNRGSSGVDLVLLGRDKSEQVTLHLSNSRYREQHWKVGNEICIEGRTSAFGTISDYESKSCNSKK